MRSGKIHIGTSGFSYRHWRGNFYPASVKAADYLKYYAEHFDSTEINASFYRLPQEEHVENWVAQVGKGFRFCPKMSRFLTHMKKLRDPEEPLSRFFGIFSAIKQHLGPILLQLPDRLIYRREVVEYFYELIRKEYKAYDFVIEVRHHSWTTEESLNLMRQYDIGLVIAQSGIHFPYSEALTAGNVYVRFHGPRELYASSYSDEQLAEFADKFKAWAKSGHNIWAYFNNDIHGYAPVDAKRLLELL